MALSFYQTLGKYYTWFTNAYMNVTHPDDAQCSISPPPPPSEASAPPDFLNECLLLRSFIYQTAFKLETSLSYSYFVCISGRIRKTFDFSKYISEVHSWKHLSYRWNKTKAIEEN
jgi:hypothetical protein